MKTSLSRFENVLKNCTVFYNRQKISYYSLLEKSIEFFADLIKQSSESNGRGIILHPGSNIHLVIMTVVAALNCVLYDESSQDDIVYSLNIGDRVIYKKKRGVFKGIDDKGRAVIEQANSLISYVPKERFFRIIPYKGSGETLDGRGIRENPEEHQLFLSKMLKMKPRDIPSVINRSFVIVCSKQEADLIINNTELCINDSGEKVALRSLFPAAYYTFNDVYYYGGNYAKTEPVLKFTGKVSVARKLIIEDRSKKIFGLLVNGSRNIEAGLPELIGLLSRKSLRNVLLLSRIDDIDYRTILNEFENLKIFAWTKEAILLNKLDLKNETTDEMKLLVKYINNILDKDINYTLHELDLDLDLNILKKTLQKIAREEPAGKEQKDFAIYGFNLLNLLVFSIFPMQVLESQIALKAIEAVSPLTQFKNLISIAKEYKGSLEKEMLMVIEILFQFYKKIYADNPKQRTLYKIIYNSYVNKQNIAIIIPKYYYKTVFEATIKNKHLLKCCEFISKESFRNDKFYDQIIFSGAFKGKKFNLFGTNASPDIHILAYNFEENRIKSLIREFENINRYYDSRNYINVPLETEEYDDFKNNLSKFEDDLERYFENLIINNVASMIKQTSNEGHPTLEVARIATFESGEKAFFTKNYRPYVFDPDTGNVTETEVYRLVPGDILIFTKRTDKTKDIVDKVLDNLINSEGCEEHFKESYRKSLYWKDVLRKYMKYFDLSFKDIADKMSKFGCEKHEVTIRSWLDEDSHIVGPREPETFYAIAAITQDKYLLKDPERFCEACNEVRSMRIRILKYIGLSIIKSVGGTFTTDEYLEKLLGDVSEFAITLQIENIIQANGIFIPSYLANRPHDF